MMGWGNTTGPLKPPRVKSVLCLHVHMHARQQADGSWQPASQHILALTYDGNWFDNNTGCGVECCGASQTCLL